VLRLLSDVSCLAGGVREGILMPNVVVIDDDRSVCEMIRRSLEKIDLVVLTVAKPEDGLNAIRKRSPDVVLLDIMLPGTSGLEVFQKIRDIDRRLPIIFVTAGSDSATAIRAMQLGGFDYVTKPLDLPSLSELVEKAIATRRMMSTPVALQMSDGEFPDAESFVGRLVHRVFTDSSGERTDKWGVVHFRGDQHHPNYVEIRYEDGTEEVTTTRGLRTLRPLPAGTPKPDSKEAEQATVATASAHVHVLLQPPTPHACAHALMRLTH